MKYFVEIDYLLQKSDVIQSSFIQIDRKAASMDAFNEIRSS